MNKRTISASLGLLASILVLSAPNGAAAAPAKYKIRWVIGHPNPDYFEEAAVNFKTAVEAKSHGEISVDIVTARFDGSETSPEAPEIAGKVERGEIEMGHSFVDVMGGLEPRFHAFEDPYLMRGYRHMEGVIEGPVGREMLDGLKSHHLVGLSFTYSGGSSGVATVDRELRRPEDLKGLKVGVYGDEVNAAWLTSLGASPVPIGHKLEKILPLAAEGSLDAVVTTWRNFQRTALDPKFRYFNMPDSTFLVSVTYANDKFFASLPAAYQTMLLEESRKAGSIERAKTIELNENAKAGMLAKGVVPVYLSQAGAARFKEALGPAHERIARILGKAFVLKIQNTPDAPEHPSVPGSVASR